MMSFSSSRILILSSRLSWYHFFLLRKRCAANLFASLLRSVRVSSPAPPRLLAFDSPVVPEADVDECAEGYTWSSSVSREGEGESYSSDRDIFPRPRLRPSGVCCLRLRSGEMMEWYGRVSTSVASAGCTATSAVAMLCGAVGLKSGLSKSCSTR